MKGNTTILSHPLFHTKTLSLIHTIKYLLFSLSIYYLPYLLHITLVTYLLFIAQPTFNKLIT